MIELPTDGTAIRHQGVTTARTVRILEKREAVGAEGVVITKPRGAPVTLVVAVLEEADFWVELW